MQKLKLTPKQIRGLQEKHGIKNLLNPGSEDGAKLATIDFLVDFTFEGSRKWQDAPTREKVEDEFDTGEMLAATKAFLSGEAGGNG